MEDLRRTLRGAPNRHACLLTEVWQPLAAAAKCPRLRCSVRTTTTCRNCGNAVARVSGEWAFPIFDGTPALETFTAHAEGRCGACGAEELTQRAAVTGGEWVMLWVSRTTKSNGVRRFRCDVPAELSGEAGTYALHAVAKHTGRMATAGHWTAEVRVEGRWWSADDQCVAAIDAPSGGANVAALLFKRCEGSVPAAPGAVCRASTKNGKPCKGVAVAGHPHCSAHLYATRGSGTCGAVSATSGNVCGTANAAGLPVCAFHAVSAAASKGHGPPLPGGPLTSGPRLFSAAQVALPPAVPVRASAPEAPTLLLGALKRQELPPPFRCGPGRMPPAAALQGHAIASLQMLGPDAIPPPALRGISASQRREHRRVLTWMLGMPAELRDLPLPTATLMALELRRRQCHWGATTWEKILGSALGAMAHLSMYTTSPSDLPLASTAAWRDALKAARIASHEWQTKPAPDASPADVADVVRTAESQQVAAQIALAWLTAARVGCILQLKRRDVTLGAVQDSGSAPLTVQFRRGKGVRFRGPYTVHTSCPAEWNTLLVEALRGAQPDQFLWPCETPMSREERGKRVTAALRRTNAALEQTVAASRRTADHGPQRGARGDTPQLQRSHVGDDAPPLPRLGPSGLRPRTRLEACRRPPSWWPCLGVRPPSWRDVAGVKSSATLPLHVKPVPPVNFSASGPCRATTRKSPPSSNGPSAGWPILVPTTTWRGVLTLPRKHGFATRMCAAWWRLGKPSRSTRPKWADRSKCFRFRSWPRIAGGVSNTPA